MSFLARACTMGRGHLRRAGHWETLAKAMPASRQGDFNATVAAFQKRKEKADNTEAAAPIDFAQYEKILGKKEVAAIKKEYESFQYTDFEAAKKAELAEVEEQLAKTVTAIEEMSASLSAKAAEASVELAELKRTRTTLETTLSDVIRREPELYAQLQERVANEDWDTETKPIDVNAMRLEAIEKNWDSATLGSMDENTQKEFLEEIAALEASSQGAADAAEVPEAITSYIAEWQSLLGAAGDNSTREAFVAANTVTADDLAITNEKDLFQAIDLATELCQFERANALLEHAQSLKSADAIVVDDEWRQAETKRLTTARHHREFNALPSSADIEGKSAEELETLAHDAAGRSDFYNACFYMYHARVQSGDIEAGTTDLDSFAGYANHFHRVSTSMAQ